MVIKETWNLDDLYPGGLQGEAYKAHLNALIEERDELMQKMANFDLESLNESEPFVQLLKEIAHFAAGHLHAATYAQMVGDADMRDETATEMVHYLEMIEQPFQAAYKQFIKKYTSVTDEQWQMLLKDDYLDDIRFVLNEERAAAKRLLSDESEALLAQLSSDGLNGWSSIYDTTSASLTIKVELSDGKYEFSVGQAMNRMYGDPNPENRRKIFVAWEDAFTEAGPIFADILNHLAGYRRTTQKNHGYTHYLDEPLECNRMQKATLEAMWQAVDASKDIFIDFLKRKQQLLGMEQLNWQDVDAPLTFTDTEPVAYNYQEACDFVVEQFGTFGPKLQAFAKHALENRWVEAENRSGKRPGGYCTDLPLVNESRIFMTFTGSASDASTLAHELGHAFHTDVLKDAPYWNRNYAMNVAETASTLAETIVANANLAKADTAKQRLQLLNVKLENATAMFLNIRARFLFESKFYEAREAGFVSESRLNQMMEDAQKEAYGDALDVKHPHFWASKLHFFADDVPFYNFPYTFGYLFSLGLYVEFLKDTDGFEERYIALLKDTGKMTVEDLAKKHLNVDLTQIEFWQQGVELAAEDAKRFIAESEPFINESMD